MTFFTSTSGWGHGVRVDLIALVDMDESHPYVILVGGERVDIDDHAQAELVDEDLVKWAKTTEYGARIWTQISPTLKVRLDLIATFTTLGNIITLQGDGNEIKFDSNRGLQLTAELHDWCSWTQGLHPRPAGSRH
jgi:hypothetical protein